MYYAIASADVATPSLDMTSALAPLGIGLLGLLILSAGMITWIAVQHYWEQQNLHISKYSSSEHPAVPMKYKQAA